MVSGFHGFIQIGIGVGIGIGIDCLTTNTRDGTARVFIHRFTQITQIFWGIARVFLERQGEFLIFMKFHVFHGFIQIGIGIAIAIDYLTTEHFLGFLVSCHGRGTPMPVLFISPISADCGNLIHHYRTTALPH